MPWFDGVPATLTVEQGGAQVSVVEHPFVKESPDLGHFIKKSLDTHREVGARIPLKVTSDAEREAWKKEHLPKLYAGGVLTAPPATPADYKLVKPEGLPASVSWSDERAGAFATLLHKHGVSKAAADELLKFHLDDVMAATEVSKTDYDTAMAALRVEHGDKFDERLEQSKRLTKLIFKEQGELDFLERTGIGNHPKFLSMLMRLAPLAAQDTSIGLDEGGGGAGVGATGEAVRAELMDIMTNKSNPKNAAYWKQDPAVMAYIDGLYKKAYGAGQITI